MKTVIKCRITWHLIRVCTIVAEIKIIFQGTNYNIIKIPTLNPIKYNGFMCGSRNSVRGVPGRTARKQPWQHFFFFSVHILTIMFTEGVQWFINGIISEKTIFFQDFRGVQHFPGGSNFFKGGPNTNIYRNPYILWFSRGVPTPGHPLWIRTCDFCALTTFFQSVAKLGKFET